MNVEYTLPWITTEPIAVAMGTGWGDRGEVKLHLYHTPAVT